MDEAVPPSKTDQRVLGIDTWRFILATWVFIGHLGLPTVPADWEAGPLRLLVRGIRGNLVSGPAAVIVFFVLSGFCIHYPNRRTNTVQLLPYFARRHIRIWLPVLASVGLTLSVGNTFAGLNESILWSLVCEEAYYILYPAMLPLVRRHGWAPLIAVSFVAAYGLVALLPNDGNYPSYGIWLNWVVGLPCWLLGAQMAGSVDAWKKPPGSPAMLWALRFGAMFLCGKCSVLRFHTPLTYPWTLNLFAVFCTIWLKAEISHAATRPQSRAESLGAASYSIYLMHLVGHTFVLRLGVSPMDSLAQWLLTVAATLGLCWLFYLLVEKPSHLASRWVARRLLR